jgi:dynein heavy chain
MATFNNLLEQIKSPRCRAVVGVLQSAKSKSINRWKDLVCLNLPFFPFLHVLV